MATLGKPHTTVTDNGTSFVGAAREFYENTNDGTELWLISLLHSKVFSGNPALTERCTLEAFGNALIGVARK